ncbi:MAG TPA: DUF86 domain-containing protein [Hyphomonas sp.]|nr:DUF86 domain-containing protein [Hyphomonas sp.]HRJ47238.1 DUF86 domain-containing protein [Opitutaceae bacterium]
MFDDRQSGLLRDMLDSALLIRTYLESVDRNAFMADSEKQDAVLRRFEIIGEAANRVSPEAQALFPGIPFRAMRGMRNIIAHDYGEVDLDLVWRTTEADLPRLIEVLERHFRGNKEGSPG